MSYTLDRLYDEKPTMIEVVGLTGEVKGSDYLMHLYFEQVAPDKMTGRPGTRFLYGPEDTALYYVVSLANQVWVADVILEDDDGNLLVELTANDDDSSTVGTRELFRVTDFTP